MSPYTAYIVETFVTLAVVCGLAATVLWAARRSGLAPGTRGPLELCGHLQLDARRAVYLVKVADQVFILGVGENGLTKIGEADSSCLPDVTRVQRTTFAEVLSRFGVAKKESTPTPSGPPVDEAPP